MKTECDSEKFVSPGGPFSHHCGKESGHAGKCSCRCGCGRRWTNPAVSTEEALLFKRCMDQAGCFYEYFLQNIPLDICKMALTKMKQELKRQKEVKRHEQNG